jgi:hypothetical protein
VWCHGFFFPKRRLNPSLCIKKMHTAFIIIYSTKVWQNIHQQPEATTQHLQTRQWWEDHAIRALCPHTQTTPHQLGTRCITESPYSKLGAHLRSSRPSTWCSRSLHHRRTVDPSLGQRWRFFLAHRVNLFLCTSSEKWGGWPSR